MRSVSPTAFLWLLLAVPLIAFYFLKIRPRLVTVASLDFWRGALTESQPRQWWQTLRDPISLFVTLLLLSLLTVALANPVRSAWFEPPQTWVIVVDVSASMRATDVAPNRLAGAKERVGRLIRRAGPRDQFAIIRAGAQPSVVCGLTSHRPTASSALAALQPTDATSSLTDSISLASRILATQSRRQLIVATDISGPPSLPGDQLDADEPTWLLVGSDTNNAGITEFQVRRSVVDQTAIEVLLEVFNASTEPLESTIELQLEQSLIDVVPVSLAAGETFRSTRQFALVAGGVIRATLTQNDVLATDNHATAVLPPASIREVTLATPGNIYLETVLRTLPLVQLNVVSAVPSSNGSAPPSLGRAASDQTFRDDSILVVDRLPLPDANSAPSDAPRKQLIVGVAENTAWLYGPPVNEVVIAKVDDDSPLLTHLDLQAVPVQGATQLTLPADSAEMRCRVLASTADDLPILASCTSSRGDRSVILNLSLQQGDFPLKTAFPVLMANAIQWLATQSDSFRPALKTGSVVAIHDLPLSDFLPVVTLPTALTTTSVGPRRIDWQLLAPDGISTRFGSNSPARIGPLELAGLWQLQGSPQPTQGKRAATLPEMLPTALAIATNLADKRESDLRGKATLSGSVLPSDRTADNWQLNQPWWYYLVVTALLISSVEWGLYHRRWLS